MFHVPCHAFTRIKNKNKVYKFIFLNGSDFNFRFHQNTLHKKACSISINGTLKTKKTVV